MNKFTENKIVKSLILASILTLGINSTYANDNTIVEETPQGTLDKLAGQKIPNTDPVQYYPADGSAYTLTKIQEGGDKPAGDNIVTKFIYNDETQSLTPVYYQLDLKQTTYGEGNSVKYYGWTNDENGNRTFGEVEQTNANIFVNYNNLTDKTYGTEYKDKNYEAEVTEGGSSSAPVQEIHSALQNAKGNTISIENAIFQNNTVTINYNDEYDNYIEVFSSGIYNTGNIDTLNADFINNSVKMNKINYGMTFNYGGAITNQQGGIIHNITGTFIGNNTQGNNTYGGAIYNNGNIDNITGDFIENYSVADGNAEGGAIYNLSNTIENINGNFLGNYVYGSGTTGGAIYNNYNGKIGKISGHFIGNYSNATLFGSSGGVIYNMGNIEEINGNFIGNYAQAIDTSMAGAIYNANNINKITGSFIGNFALSEKSSAYGGAIYNTKKIDNITGDFIGNYTSAIKYESYGGAITNEYGTISNIFGDFIGNYAHSENSYTYGGAIYNNKTIENITGDFVGNYIHTTGRYAYGGAIYNKGTIGEIIDGNLTGGISGSFINNHATTESSSQLALGGAIYTTKDLNFIANNKNIEFTGNYTEDSTQGKVNNAIFVLTTSNPKITLEAKNNGNITFNDQIDGGTVSGTTIDRKSQYSLNITGDNTGKVIINNEIINANITLSNTNLYLGKENVFDKAQSLTLNSGLLSMVNNSVGIMDIQSLTIQGDTNFVADVDLANRQMDRITANSYGTHNGNINVIGMNMLSDMTEGTDVTEIIFAEQGLKDNVVNGLSEIPTSHQTTAYTPIYKYNVMYDNRDDAGYFLFTKGDKIFVPAPDEDGGTTVIPGGGSGGGTTVIPTPGGNASSAFNPSVLSSPVAAQAGAYAAQNAVFNYAFQNADSFMPLPAAERFALRNANKYAITGYDKLDAVDNEFKNKAIWVRPYTSFENIPLKNGPKVDTITYGTLIGGDSDFKELRNGWGTIFTGYIGYNGSSQSYSGVNTYQNGGLIGATQTFYKGNFFTALTASAGATAGESHNMYGHENFSSLMAGVANKSGYNIEFKEGKFIIQPTLMLAYSFINTFDYTNSAGVKINSDPLHAIQINPNVKFIGNLKNSWQPYASVGMVWNILDDTKVMANDVRLPEMSVKPYVEYGVGVQKRWKDRCTGYLQAMIRNGGRNGIVLTGGFRWAIGKEGKPIEKVSNPQNKTAQVSNNNRKILKQLSPAQRTALGAKTQNTTRTSCIGEVK